MIATGTAMLVSGLASGGAMAYGAKKQGDAAKRVGREQTAANESALAFERENEARRRQEFDLIEAENARRWDEAIRREDARFSEDIGYRNRMADEDRRRYENQERVRTPYRTAGQAALADLDARRKASMADLVGGV